MRAIIAIALRVALSTTALAWGPAATAAPARLVKDIRPGPAISHIAIGNVAVDGKLLFLADDGVHGSEPWVSDGTAEGTHLVKDINSGRHSSFHGNFFPCHSRAYFAPTEGAHGFELWRTDGTEAGTRMVKDIFPGAALHGASSFACLGSQLFFSANDGVHGFELWATDGTEEGTNLVHDIRPGASGSNPNLFSQFGSLAFFVANDGVTRDALWRSDGTKEGTFPLIPLDSGVHFDPPVEFRGDLWLITYDIVGPSKLWRTDGTLTGTVHVSDIGPILAAWLTVAGDTLFFQGYDAAGGIELWATDGTGPGTHRVKDIWPGPLDSLASDLTAVGSNLFFSAVDPSFRSALWRTDGTEAGTLRLKEGILGAHTGAPVGMAAVAGMLLFGASDDNVWGVWRSDGSKAGTIPVQYFGGPYPYFVPTDYLEVGTRVFFSGFEPSTGRELWTGRAAVLTHQPARALEDLADEVRALGLPDGIARSLIAKLEAAGAALARGDGTTAVRMLETFQREARALSPSSLSTSAAAGLLEFAEEIAPLLAAQ